MPEHVHPCYKRLTAECFREYPQWAKAVFAYRLMIAICPEQIARNLPTIMARLGIPVPPMMPPPVTQPTPTPAGAPPAPAPPPPGPPPTWPAPPPGAPAVPPAPPSGGVPPIFIPPWEPGPVHSPSPSPTEKIFTTTIYAEVSDGWVMNTDTTWDLTHDATTGMDYDDTGLYSEYGLCAEFYAGDYRIYRGFFRFDLSIIPANAEIIKAYLRLSTYENAASCVVCQRGTQGLAISEEDFKSFTGPSFGNVYWQEYDPNNPGENEIYFNDEGLTYLKSQFGYMAKLCLRERDHDYYNTCPMEEEGEIRNGIYFSEQTWEERKPQLEITYKI